MPLGMMMTTPIADCRLGLPKLYTGGALLLGTSIILHFKQKIEYVLSVNEFGDQETQFYVVPGGFFATATVTTTVTSTLNSVDRKVWYEPGAVYIHSPLQLEPSSGPVERRPSRAFDGDHRVGWTDLFSTKAFA